MRTEIKRKLSDLSCVLTIIFSVIFFIWAFYEDRKQYLENEYGPQTQEQRDDKLEQAFELAHRIRKSQGR